MTLIKSFTRTIIIVAITIIICGIYFNKCGSKSTEPIIKVNQKEVNDRIEKLQYENVLKDSSIAIRERKNRIDSVKITSAMLRYKKAYQNAIKQAPDTCKSYIDTIYAECNKVDSMRVNYSLKQDSTIKDLKVKNKNLEQIVIKKDTIINTKNDSIKIVKALLKPRFWKGFKAGFATGAVLIQGANTSIKLIK